MTSVFLKEVIMPKDTRDASTQRNNHMKRQQEGSSLKEKERGLRKQDLNAL
jgi:hypothetical protein